MTKPTDIFVQDAGLCKIMHTLFKKNIANEFRGRSKIQLCEYLDEDTLNENWDKTLDSACSECWIILQNPSEYILREFYSARDDLQDDVCSLEDFSKRVCKAVLKVFHSKITDTQRDREYALLRQAIDRKKENGKPVFLTKFIKDRGGMFFAPYNVLENIPREIQNLLDIPQSLSSVNPAIRKAKTIDRGIEGVCSEMFWDTDIVASEANRFWHAFVQDFYDGEAGLVPLYTMYCWIKQHICIDKTNTLSLDAPKSDSDGENEDSLIDTIPDKTLNAEEGVALAETLEDIERQVKAFVDDLPQQEMLICALLFEPGATMASVAEAMGLQGPSSLQRHKDRLLHRIREHATQLDDRECMEWFVLGVQDECKKRCPAPIIMYRGE